MCYCCCVSEPLAILQQTALHWSAYYNNPEHVKLLIKHDSNIGIPDVEGKIPLHWAANHKDPSAVHTVRCILVSTVVPLAPGSLADKQLFCYEIARIRKRIYDTQTNYEPEETKQTREPITQEIEHGSAAMLLFKTTQNFRHAGFQTHPLYLSHTCPVLHQLLS